MAKYTFISYRKHVGGEYTEYSRSANISLTKALYLAKIGFANFEKVEIIES